MDKCACKGDFLEKFIQPSILTLLVQENLHGFLILKRLNESRIMDYSSIDPAGLYRTLKKMEGNGLLDANWVADAAGKQIKVYAITAEGKHCLANWLKTLNEYQADIDRLAQAVAQSLV